MSVDYILDALEHATPGDWVVRTTKDESGDYVIPTYDLLAIMGYGPQGIGSAYQNPYNAILFAGAKQLAEEVKRLRVENIGLRGEAGFDRAPADAEGGMMFGNTTLGDLIGFLEKQNPSFVVEDGFGSPHSDRGSYDELAFDQEETTTFGKMLDNARSAVNQTFTGYKGGEYLMDRNTPVLIGNWGQCGDAITPIHFKYWALIASAPQPEEKAR